METQNNSNALTDIGPTLTDKPYNLTIPVAWAPEIKRTFLDKILRRPLPAQETKRTFTISPCLVGNMYRIASRAARLPNEIKDGSAVEVLMPLIPVCMPDIIYIVAAAIQNNHLEPAPDLMLFIERNFTQEKIFEALYASLEGVGLDVFYNSIASVKGTIRIIQPEASPIDGNE